MKELDLFWIRHSVTFDNLHSFWEKIYKYDKKKSIDPSIIPSAEAGSCFLEKKMDSKIKNCKLIGCSQLKRAIQTSILMFPDKFKNKKIKILKGIREISIGPGNWTQKEEPLKKQLFIWCKNVMNIDVCEKLKNYFKTDKDDKKLLSCIESLFSDLNDKNFNKIKNNNIVDEDTFISCLKPYLEEKKISRFAIVSHSNYIKYKILDKNIISKNKDKLQKNGKLHNNQILNKKFKFDEEGNVTSIYQEIYHFGCTQDMITCCFHDKNTQKKCQK